MRPEPVYSVFAAIGPAFLPSFPAPRNRANLFHSQSRAANKFMNIRYLRALTAHPLHTQPIRRRSSETTKRQVIENKWRGRRGSNPRPPT